MTIILRSALILFLFTSSLRAQVTFSQQDINLGNVGAVYEIRGDVVVSNQGENKVHLLRAKADDGVTVFTSKRTLQPGDTALIVISFQPHSRGSFNKKITLFTSEQIAERRLSLSGEVEQVRTNDLTACYNFGSRRLVPARNSGSPVELHGIPVRSAPDSHGMGHISRPRVTSSAPPQPAVKKAAPSRGPLDAHLPNNLVLLVDISSSMRDSLKLPLMKSELHQLINAIREVDSVSLITYNDSVRVRATALSGRDKETLHAIVDGLKARGMTKGKKAILFAQEIAQRHYVKGGSNILFLASDGEFRFTAEDQETWNRRQAAGTVTISTVAFGDDRDALRTLKQIASKGGGSFIHIRKRSDATARLLDDVEKRSRVAAVNR